MDHTNIIRLKSSLISAILSAIILFNSCNEDAVSPAEQYRLPDSLFSSEYFSLLDEAGYVHNKEYESYIIFIKSFPFLRSDLVFSLQTLDSGKLNIASLYRLVYSEKSPVFATINQKMTYGFRGEKKTWLVRPDTALAIRDKINGYVTSVSNRSDSNLVANDGGGCLLLYFDGRRGYEINDENSSRGFMRSINNYILDSLLGLEPKYGVKKDQ